MDRLLAGLPMGPPGDTDADAETAVRAVHGSRRPGREAGVLHGPSTEERLEAIARGPVLVLDTSPSSSRSENGSHGSLAFSNFRRNDKSLPVLFRAKHHQANVPETPALLYAISSRHLSFQMKTFPKISTAKKPAHILFS